MRSSLSAAKKLLLLGNCPKKTIIINVLLRLPMLTYQL